MIRIEAAFPNLRPSGYRVASPETVGYNCIAWAAGDTTRWWWPDSPESAYWPDGVQRSETSEAFVKAFETLSYTICDTPEYEEGFEKIAIYVNSNGKPTHAARQLPSGCWTSKLGQSYDIEHDLEGVSGTQYGNVGVIMKRPCKIQKGKSPPNVAIRRERGGKSSPDVAIRRERGEEIINPQA